MSDFEQQLKLAGIDYDSAIKKFSNNADMYAKYLVKFSFDTNFSQACASFAKNDYVNTIISIQIFNHTAEDLGIFSLSPYAKQLVIFLKQGNIPLAGQALAILKEQYEKVTSLILSIKE